MAPRDTSDEAAAVQTAAFRAMTRAERAEMALAMCATADEVAASGIRHRHPDYTDEQVEMALRRLYLGDDLMSAAYPGVPLVGP